MTPKELLIQARALIATPEAWTKGASARNAAGISVPSLHPTAVKWCALGALRKAINEEAMFPPEPFDQARTFLFRGSGRQWLVDLNDNPATTHADVLAVFDAAIRLAENADAE